MIEIDNEKFIDVEDVKYSYNLDTANNINLYEEEPKDAKDVVYSLKGINIKVKKGELLCILGTNGSGKSTLGKLINAQIQPTEGDVFIMNMNTKNEKTIWDVRKNCGMVFQNPDNQLVATLVEEEVAFGPENLGVPREEIRKRVDESLKVVNMQKYIKDSPAMLSGGQKQRIAIASILAMKPECILFDEATSMLDPKGRKDIIKTIQKLNKEEDKTIIYITHYMDEAILADRIIIVRDGNIIKEGKPKEIFKEVEFIKEIGLDVPQVTEISNKLRKDGFDISPDNIFIEELVNDLCK